MENIKKIKRDSVIDGKFIGVWIRDIRVKVLDLSQMKLAEKISKTPEDISRYERGVNMPPAIVIFNIQKLVLESEINREI